MEILSYGVLLINNKYFNTDVKFKTLFIQYKLLHNEQLVLKKKKPGIQKEEQGIAFWLKINS